MITEEKSKDLELELQPYKKHLGETSDVILDQDVTNYPIFIVHQQEMNVGIPLDFQQVSGPWSVNASSLEEFVTKQLIAADKVDNFTAVYKDPKAFLCLFLVNEGSATFAFVPRI